MKRTVVGGIAALSMLALASPASAEHHLLKIKEVYPGSVTAPAAEFVELQLPRAGENRVSNNGGSSVSLYGPAGTLVTSGSFAANPPNGEAQRTILAGTASVVGPPDLVLIPGGDITGAGGTACFNSLLYGPLDCVSWGTATPPPGLSPSGTPEPAIPDGFSLCRSTDTDDSAADFSPEAPTPTNNNAPAAAAPCVSGGGGDGGGGGGGGGGGTTDTKPPQTEIDKAPKAKSEKTTAKFRFSSDEPGSKYECKLDKRRFKACSSPKTYENLDPGKHKFSVAATDQADNTDPSPATHRFRVVED